MYVHTPCYYTREYILLEYNIIQMCELLRIWLTRLFQVIYTFIIYHCRNNFLKYINTRVVNALRSLHVMTVL